MAAKLEDTRGQGEAALVEEARVDGKAAGVEGKADEVEEAFELVTEPSRTSQVQNFGLKLSQALASFLHFTLGKYDKFLWIWVKEGENVKLFKMLVRIWLLSPIRSNWVNLKMFTSPEPEPSSACKYQLCQAQAELSLEIQNYFKPEPSQAQILTLSPSRAEAAQLKLFGSSQHKL